MRAARRMGSPVIGAGRATPGGRVLPERGVVEGAGGAAHGGTVMVQQRGRRAARAHEKN
jgi:hypothetical protein